MQRADFKHEQLAPHLLMNLRVVDEHGRQLGESRHLGRAEGRARRPGALGVPGAGRVAPAGARPAPPPRRAGGAARTASPAAAARARRRGARGREPTRAALHRLDLRRAARADGGGKGGQALIGYPALIDKGTHVEIEVFDEPEVAADKHRAGLRRLVALQLREPLKYLEKNLPDLQRMAVAYMPLGSAEELREQIVDVALDRAFLAEPLPADAAAFARRIDEGRGRLTLIASEVARLAGAVLAEYAAAQRKLKDARPPKEVADDVAAQLAAAGAEALPRRRRRGRGCAPAALPEGDRRCASTSCAPIRRATPRAWPSCGRSSSATCASSPSGAARATPRLDEFRWWLEELRVGLFAQELRTPQPVSAKRLEKIWAQAFA